MLTINKIFPQEKIPEKTESFLFFDIETTGFSRDNTILYLIGCGYFAEEGFQFIQWFNDDGTSEEEILLAFQNILSKKDWQLVTFNGNSFDIPYLKRHYDLNELTCDIEKYPSLDFYQFLKPFQNLFHNPPGLEQGPALPFPGFFPFISDSISQRLLQKRCSSVLSLLSSAGSDTAGHPFCLHPPLLFPCAP